jgi:hypothetical protein
VARFVRSEQVNDPAFDNLGKPIVGKWLNAGVLEDEVLTIPDDGTPQGEVVTPSSGQHLPALCARRMVPEASSPPPWHASEFVFGFLTIPPEVPRQLT